MRDEIAQDPKPELMRLLDTLCNVLDQYGLQPDDAQYALTLANRIRSIIGLAEIEIW